MLSQVWVELVGVLCGTEVVWSEFFLNLLLVGAFYSSESDNYIGTRAR
jgi:hypothetical protein